MGLRQRVRRLLDRGEPADADPSELIEIAVVPLWQAPTLVTGLREVGFDASFAETFNVVTNTLADARILVARRDAPAASEALDQIR